MWTFFAVSTLLLTSSLGLWAAVCHSRRSLILGSLILAVAQVTAALILLGLISQLNQIAVVFLISTGSALQIVLCQKSLLRALREIAESLRLTTRSARRSPTLVVGLGILFISMLLILWLGILLPPTDWDGLAQNLPMAAFHIQNENIWAIDTPYRGIRAYPQGGALLLAYTILLTGDDTLADLVQFPFWALGTLAIYALARKVGAGRSASFLGALMFATAPVTMLQARAAYFDLEVAAISLVSLALAIDDQLGTVWRSLIVGLGMGLLIGLKYAGAIHALVLLMLLGWALLYDRVGVKTTAIGLGVAIIACIAIGGCWYFFNLVHYQNPFWPMQITLNGQMLLPGVWTTDEFYQEALPSSLREMPGWLRPITIWREAAAHYTADMRLGGLGPLWFALGGPSLIFFAIQTLQQPSSRKWGILFYFLATLLLTPANWHTRYVLASIGVTGVCVATMLEVFNKIGWRLLSATIVLLASLMLFMAPAHGEASATDVLRNLSLPSRMRRTAFMNQVPAMDEALRWSEQNIPAGTTIAYGWGGVILYPLFGPGLQNKLVYAESSIDHLDNSRQKITCPDFLVVRRGSPEALRAEQGGARSVFTSEKYTIFKGMPCE